MADRKTLLYKAVPFASNLSLSLSLSRLPASGSHDIKLVDRGAICERPSMDK